VLPADQALPAAMADLGRRLDPAGTGPIRLAPDGESIVVRFGSVVVKAHHPRTDPQALAVRLELVTRPELAGIVLAPLTPTPVPAAGRWLTGWPFGRTVDPDPDTAPWTAAAELLARLHTTPVPDQAPGHPPRRLPVAGGPARVARTVEALAALDGTAFAADADLLRAAWQTVPAAVRTHPGPWGGNGGAGAASPGLAHGDWHFGQLVGVGGRWLLADVDDLGLGDPLWDLGRPAAFRAIGVVSGEESDSFLDAYRSAGGRLPGGADTWAALDVPARAYTVQTAARSLLAAHRQGTTPDDVTAELLAACRRMTRRDHGTLRRVAR
jgi:hypothetical protein